jgi:hypothetical protein
MNGDNMKYIYDVVLHNGTSITIERACLLADQIQQHIDNGGTHVQSVAVKNTNVQITVETDFEVNDLFSLIFDYREDLGIVDFSIYYNEGRPKPIATAPY